MKRQEKEMKEWKEWIPLPTGKLNPEDAKYLYQVEIAKEDHPHKTFKSVLIGCLAKLRGTRG